MCNINAIRIQATTSVSVDTISLSSVQGRKLETKLGAGPGWTLNSLIYATLKVNFSALVLKLWFYFERILCHTREE